MQLEFTCNKKHKDFTYRDIKKSDFEIRVLDETNAHRVQLAYYEEKDNHKELIAIESTTFKNGLATFKKELFKDKKKEYQLIITDEQNQLLGTYPITFKKSKTPLVILLLLLLLIGGLLLYHYLKPTNPDNLPIGNGEIGDGEFDNGDIQDYLNSQTKYLNIRIDSYINVIDGEGYFKIYNSNKDMNIQVFIYDYDKENKAINEDEVLYISPMLEPNKNVKKGSLTTFLDKGEHSAIAMFKAYDADGNFLGQAGQEIILNVE